MPTSIKEYYFGVQGKVVGPLNETEIGKLIANGTITGKTLAWCVGQPQWQPVSEIAELSQTFGPLFEAQQTTEKTSVGEHARQDGPPPLPDNYTADFTQSAEQTKASYAGEPGSLSPFQSAAYNLVCWLYPVWWGRRSMIRQYVDRDPKRAVPVAIGTLALCAVVFVMLIGAIVPTDQSSPSMPMQPSFGQFPQGPQLSPSVFQPMIRAQQDISNTIDDVYRYNRDSFDRQCETYRRGTYDWYSHD